MMLVIINKRFFFIYLRMPNEPLKCKPAPLPQILHQGVLIQHGRTDIAVCPRPSTVDETRVSRVLIATERERY